MVNKVSIYPTEPTFIIQNRFNCGLRQAHGGCVHVQIVVQRKHKTKFTFAEVEIEVFEVSVCEMVELRLDSVETVQNEAFAKKGSIILVDVACALHFPKFVTAQEIDVHVD